MRILLIKPYWPYPYGKGEHTYNRIWLPLCLANCAALLEQQGMDVEILDAHALRIKPRKIASHVQGYDKIFLTSSSLDRWQCPNIDIGSFLMTAQQIKEVTDEIYVMGYHGTVAPERILKETGAKAVIRGEPEDTVVDICLGKPLNEIDGITYFRDNNMISNQDRKDVDLKALPVPAFQRINTKKYFYELLGGNFALFELGRGCNYTCKFCNKVMYGSRLRSKTHEQVCRELCFAIEQCNVKTGYFMDLEFLAHKNLVADVCDFLIRKNYDFRWCCQTRADSLDEEILNKMKKAGCRLVHIGVESGIQRILDLSQKNTARDHIDNAIRMCREADIKTLAFFIFGFKEETKQDRMETFEFAKQLNANYVSFHKVYPYRDSDIYMSNISANREIDNSIRQMYISYYLRPAHWLKNDLGVMARSLTLFLNRLRTLS